MHPAQNWLQKFRFRNAAVIPGTESISHSAFSDVETVVVDAVLPPYSDGLTACEMGGWRKKLTSAGSKKTDGEPTRQNPNQDASNAAPTAVIQKQPKNCGIVSA